MTYEQAVKIAKETGCAFRDRGRTLWLYFDGEIMRPVYAHCFSMTIAEHKRVSKHFEVDLVGRYTKVIAENLEKNRMERELAKGGQSELNGRATGKSNRTRSTNRAPLPEPPVRDTDMRGLRRIATYLHGNGVQELAREDARSARERRRLRLKR